MTKLVVANVSFEFSENYEGEVNIVVDDYGEMKGAIFKLPSFALLGFAAEYIRQRKLKELQEIGVII